MKTLIEQIAQAVALDAVEQNHMLELTEDGMGFYDEYDNKTYDCRRFARVAIEAMRQPTDEMIQSGFGTGVFDNDAAFAEPAMAKRVYEAMIASALIEPLDETSE